MLLGNIAVFLLFFLQYKFTKITAIFLIFQLIKFRRTHVNLKLIEFLPEYDKYGRQAPLIRNKLIVENCDCLIAFWDGVSRGTKYTIDYATKMGKPVKIVQI